MCNLCSCDFQDKCSIVGQIPLGFCCPKCEQYEEEHACIKLVMKVETKIPAGLKSFAEKKVVISNENALIKNMKLTDDY